MASKLIDKLTGFLMPDESSAQVQEEEQTPARGRKIPLQLHSQAALKVYIAIPRNTEEICHLADCLKNKIALVINYKQIDEPMQQNIHDFLCGVAYVTNSNYTRITDRVYMYVPGFVEFDKRLFATTIPTYVKKTL